MLAEVENEDYEIIPLVDEDGNEHDFALLGVVEVENFEYAILLPLEEEEGLEEDEGEAIILKIITDEEGNQTLEGIDDDEEWEKVADAWEELQDAGE